MKTVYYPRRPKGGEKMNALDTLLNDWQNDEELHDQIREGFRQSRSDRWIADNCQISIVYVAELRYSSTFVW
jgi:hypothetical protein